MMQSFRVSKYVNVDTENDAVTIQRPWANMQTDYACFEAIALLLRCENPDTDMQLHFSRINWDGQVHNLDIDQQHYMRFLFRVMRFTEFHPWLTVGGQEQKAVDQFKKLLTSGSPVNNVPDVDAEFNPEKGQEHVVENEFYEDFRSGSQYLSRLLCASKEPRLTSLHHQMPNGLFAQGKVSSETRIFPTGFFDLWGINEEQELCLFELKIAGNKKMGLLSELFFYAEYASEFLTDPQVINSSATKHRDYNKLLDWSRNGVKKVRAYFLVPEGELHPQIDKNKDALLKLLNINTGISYHFLPYERHEAALEKAGQLLRLNVK